LPVAAEGCTILDLGCGSGRDVYLLSQLVGEQGEVIGIDMTEEQLTVARKHIDWHTEKFGYKSPNVRFKLGYIEDLTSIGIKDDSVDIIISNCVINLSPNKEAVFKEIFRVLKPGGELFFSDVFADRRIPEKLQLNPTLLGECLGGALYLGDFQRLMARVGLSDSRIISQRELTIDDPDIKAMAGMITFYSMTVRAFKLNLDESRENFAQVARYLGTIPECPDSFVLDADLQFATEEPVPICSNTAMMLSKTRLAKHFKVHGDCDIHYGAFDPSPIPETDINLEQPSTGCC
jgi:SAM-dependent methyltransferase